jgi:hypothetical protein
LRLNPLSKRLPVAGKVELDRYRFNGRFTVAYAATFLPFISIYLPLNIDRTSQLSKLLKSR